MRGHTFAAPPPGVRTVAIGLSLLTIALLASSCAGNGERTKSEAASDTRTTAQVTAQPNRSATELSLPIRVAVTLPLFEEFAREMGKENVEVISLIPPGADPNTYEFTAEDIARMKGIDFFFVNGLGLDSRLQDVIEANRDQGAHVIPFAPNILSPRGGDVTAEQAGDNPHLWLDPTLAYVYPEIVSDEFIIYDGIRTEFYKRNFVAYRDKVLALQDQVQQILAAIPADRRKLVTQHDSFAHFARRFGFTVSGYVSADTQAHPAAEDINRLTQLVRDQQIPAIFADFGYDSGPMQQVAAAAGVRLCMLYSDIINGDVTTYDKLMLANAQEIVRCLGTQ